MANGSFGLSGIPTAPTSVGVAPNNPFTPVSVAVNSTAGFESGDLIYNFGGDIGPVPNTAGGTGTFPVTDTAPTYAQNISSGEMMLSPVNGGYAYRGNKKAAVLTNGNIVLVYLRINGAFGGDNHPRFKIIDENGTVIVADTTIQAATGQNGMISVCALTGGGFAVAWNPSAGTGTSYAIYSNTGTVVTAATNDTGAVPTSTSVVAVAARPDGSWIVATTNSGNALFYKVFSATGVQVYAWTNAVTTAGSSAQIEIIVRSDGSFVLLYVVGSNVYYLVRSSTNTSLKVSTQLSTSALGNAANWGGATLIASDSTLVTWSNGGTMYRGVIDSASNISEAQTQYTFNTTRNWQWVTPWALTGGNYLLTFAAVDYTTTTLNSYILGYAVLNSSNVVVQSSSSGGYVYSFTAANAFQPTAFQTANYIHVFGTGVAYNYSTVVNGWNNGSPVSMQWARISPTTYETIKANSTTVSVGNTSAQALSGYARSGSTPTTASFFPATTTTVLTTTSAGTVVVPQTTIDTGTVVAIDTASLTDGTCLILYRLGSAGALKLAVVSAAGVLLSTTTIVASTSTSYATTNFTQCYRIALLTDGKIAVSYVASGDIVTLAILSSTYSILTTLTLTNVGFTNGNYDGFGLAAITNARFVFVYRRSDTARVAFRVYNSSLVIQSSEADIGTATATATPTCAGTQGGFSVSYTDYGGGSYQNYSYFEVSTNTWSAANVMNNNVSGNFIRRKMVTGPNGTPYDISSVSAGGVNVWLYASTGLKAGSNVPQFEVTDMAPSASINNNSQITLAVTAYAEPIVIGIYNATSIATRYNTAGGGVSTASGSSTLISGISAATTSAAVVSAVALTGRTVLVAFLNAANQLTYLTYNAGAVTYTTPLVAGVTISNPVSITVAKGFSLVGVSSTAAPANGQGTVVINGPAQLNSNYPASTTGRSFNFGNPVTFGAAGTISGRNVNLIGNV